DLARRANDQPRARLRNEHHRICREGRCALRHRFLESRAGFRARPHHPVLFRSCRGPHVQAGDWPRAPRQRCEYLAALGGDAWHWRGRRLHGGAENRGGGEVGSEGVTHSAGASPTPMAGDPADFWHSLLRPEFDRAPDFAGKFFARLRDAKLVFGGRVHCPFLRPFFLTEEDETRVRVVAETIAALGERVVVAALENRALFEQLHLRPEEERLARIPVGYARASTASRLDAFLLPDSLKFAEYNGESPAGPGYAEMLAEIFSNLPVMERFRERYEARMYGLSAKLLEALLASYTDWGGTRTA